MSLQVFSSLLTLLQQRSRHADHVVSHVASQHEIPLATWAAYPDLYCSLPVLNLGLM